MKSKIDLILILLFFSQTVQAKEICSENIKLFGEYLKTIRNEKNYIDDSTEFYKFIYKQVSEKKIDLALSCLDQQDAQKYFPREKLKYHRMKILLDDNFSYDMKNLKGNSKKMAKLEYQINSNTNEINYLHWEIEKLKSSKR